jgi:hypothetical protein
MKGQGTEMQSPVEPPRPLFERWISRPRRPWATVSVALLLLLAPVGAALLDGVLPELLSQGHWRTVYIPPAVILYILAVAPFLARMEARVVRSLRPIVLIEDDDFDRLVYHTSYVRPAHELIAFVAGALLGVLWSRVTGSSGAVSWLSLEWLLSTGLMYGLLAWTIYVSVAGTRLAATLHRQPMHVDPLDTTPFAAIGQQSLLLALVFVGGITLSLVFVAFEPQSLRNLVFWLAYLPLALVPVVVFYLNMRPTHRVLAAAKNRELHGVQRCLLRACRALVQHLDEGQETGNLPAEINGLAAYEQRLQGARTWPYDTGMLRTLFFSVLVPAGTVLVRLVVERLFG